MAWTTPITAVTNATLTAAQWNASARDNLLETPAAKFTASGQLFVSNGPNVGAARTIGANRVSGGAQGTTSTGAFTDLTTVGPSFTATTGGQALVSVSSFIQNSTAGAGGSMSFAVTGATTLAVAVQTLRFISSGAGENQRASGITWQTGLNAGSNTFTAKYLCIGSGTASFDEREISVIPL